MAETTLINRMSSLIEAEREALLAGDLERIAGLLEEKRDVVKSLSELDEIPPEIAPLQQGLKRNQELFDHALSGLRNVVKRLGSLQHLSKTLDTYDAAGQRLSIEGTGSTVERRA